MADELDVTSDGQADQQVDTASQAQDSPSTEEFRISQDDWGTLVGAVKEMYERQGAPQQYQQPQEEGEDDLEGLDLGELVDRFFQKNLQPYLPAIESAQNREGKEALESTFKSLEKQVGKFDHDVAEHFSKSFYASSNPRNEQEAAYYATQAAQQGAAMAAELKKRYSEAAINDYKKSLERTPFTDPDAAGSGIRWEKPPASMDEVIAKWAGDEEV